MSIKLSHAEYWILDMVDEIGEAIHYLANGHYGNNKRYFEYTVEELFEALKRLVDEGWIYGYTNCGNIQLTTKLLEHELRRTDIDYGSYTPEKPEPNPPLIFYRLTVAGGNAWESFAKPEWDRYIDQWGCTADEDNPELTIMTCASKELLASYVETICREEIDAKVDSFRWTERRPWNPRYWKELPVGYEVTFEVLQDRRQLREWNPVEAMLTWRHCRP
jgi:hypothetical protein